MSNRPPPGIVALGIDPGTRRIGYGLVRSQGQALTLIAAGILRVETKEDAPALEETKKELDKLIKKHRPDVVGIEKLYFAQNQKTAIAVAQARGVALLAAQESHVPIREYTPNEMKLAITGYGFADKKAVLKMVRLLLKEPDLSVIDDASDALALAVLATNRAELL